MEFVYSTRNPSVPTAYSSLDAMHTQCEILLPFLEEDVARALVGSVWDLVREADWRYNRFLPGSALAEVNRKAAGEAVEVDEELFFILQMCETFRKATLGYFRGFTSAGEGCDIGHICPYRPVFPAGHAIGPGRLRERVCAGEGGPDGLRGGEERLAFLRGKLRRGCGKAPPGWGGGPVGYMFPLCWNAGALAGGGWAPLLCGPDGPYVLPGGCGLVDARKGSPWERAYY